LNTVAGGKPYVLITHARDHAVCVNSRVLQRAGITRNTPDPAGGTIVQDEVGEPTGVLLEKDRGRIAPVQRTDFVVLNGNPLTLPLDEWTEGLSVRATIMGGEMVYGDVGI